MDIPGLTEQLRSWAERQSLVARTLEGFDDWYSRKGERAARFPRSEVTVIYSDQALQFHFAGDDLIPPRIAVHLALFVYEGECPLGSYTRWFDLEGRAIEEDVELGAETPLEELGGSTWRYSEVFAPADQPPEGPEPADGEDDLPF